MSSISTAGECYTTFISMNSKSTLRVQLNLPDQIDPVEDWFFRISSICGLGTANLIHIQIPELATNRSLNNITGTNDVFGMFAIVTTNVNWISNVTETDVGYPLNPQVINNPWVTINLTNSVYAPYTSGSNFEIVISVFKNPAKL
jgi:hypothetical protein